MAIYPHIKGVEGVLTALHKHAAIVGEDMLKEIIRTARLVAVSCATSTQPYGLGEDARFMGESRVVKDICMIFGAPSYAFLYLKKRDPDLAAAFWTAYKANQVTEMRNILDRGGLATPLIGKPDPAIHEKYRTRRRKNVSIGAPAAISIDAAALQRYITSRRKRVGFAKAGWAAAAKRCGGSRGIPRWAAGRHPTAPGGAIIKPDPYKPTVVIYNNVSYIEEILTPRDVNTAVGIAYEKILKSLDIIARKRRRLVA